MELFETIVECQDLGGTYERAVVRERLFWCVCVYFCVGVCVRVDVGCGCKDLIREMVNLQVEGIEKEDKIFPCSNGRYAAIENQDSEDETESFYL